MNTTFGLSVNVMQFLATSEEFLPVATTFERLEILESPLAFYGKNHIQIIYIYG